MHEMTNEDVAAVLNDLLETCYDGLDGFRTAIKAIDNNDIIAFCESRIQRIDEGAAELYTAIQHLGVHPVEHGHPTARLHRGWIQLRPRSPPARRPRSFRRWSEAKNAP